MPSDLFLKTANTAHRVLLKVSGGRLGWTAGSMPVVQLTTIGRKSGEPRTVMLTSPHQDGDTMVLVASRGATTTIRPGSSTCETIRRSRSRPKGGRNAP